MKIVNIQDAKTRLPHLIEAAAKGEPVVIAKAGKPRVKVEALTAVPPQRIGFLEGQIEVPDDFDTMTADEILAMFEGKHDGTGLYEEPATKEEKKG